jgi:Spy/CpxP family protein refolding chaperone
MKPRWILAAALFVATPAAAQHDHTSPYAHQERSEIAALTPQELSDLLAGAGMGMAKAAELNHFPGPRHVLELADSLRLTDSQRTRVDAIRTRMAGEAVRLGERIVAKERELDTRFVHGHIDADALRALTAEIARLQGELRYVHLAAHIETKAVLDGGQVQLYDRLRGYGEAGGG